MSMKEIIEVFNNQLRDYLLQNGFNKPIKKEGLLISNVLFPERKIYISSAPMFRNCIFYEFVIPGLDDRQSIFNYSIKYLDYNFNSIGWYQYNDLKELNGIFNYIKDIHDSWLNRIFNEDNIDIFINRINEIRRKEIEKYALLSESKKKIEMVKFKKDDIEHLENIRIFIKKMENIPKS